MYKIRAAGTLRTPTQLPRLVVADRHRRMPRFSRHSDVLVFACKSVELSASQGNDNVDATGAAMKLESKARDWLVEQLPEV
jgi:hypothetical protein